MPNRGCFSKEKPDSISKVQTYYSRFLLAVSKHQTLQAFGQSRPSLGQGGFVAPSASLIGNVTLGKGSSVWYGAVLRGAFDGWCTLDAPLSVSISS